MPPFLKPNSATESQSDARVAACKETPHFQWFLNLEFGLVQPYSLQSYYWRCVSYWHVVVDVAMHLGMGVLLLSSISWCSVDIDESARPEWRQTTLPIFPKKRWSFEIIFLQWCSGRRCWAGNAWRALYNHPTHVVDMVLNALQQRHVVL